MRDRELMQVQIDALFTHDVRGRMVHVNEPGGKAAPRFFLGTTAHGHIWRFRHDLGHEVEAELDALCLAEPVRDVAELDTTRYEDVLARVGPIQSVYAGPAYRFPLDLPDAPPAIRITEDNSDVLRPYLEEWLPDVGYRDAMFAVVVGGHAVAIASSVRTSAVADEVGVETAAEFRGRGYASQAVITWAREIRSMNRIPLYSTSWDNVASQALAHSLGLSVYGADLNIR
jgi:hypothetical protein